MRSPWFWLMRQEGKALMALAVLVGLVAVAWIGFPGLQRPNAGFGPDWDCTSVGKGDPVCVKKPPQAPVDQSPQK